jgi:hypothetical protein
MDEKMGLDFAVEMGFEKKNEFLHCLWSILRKTFFKKFIDTEFLKFNFYM